MDSKYYIKNKKKLQSHRVKDKSNKVINLWDSGQVEKESRIQNPECRIHE
jgi:hypothetical protein